MKKIIIAMAAMAAAFTMTSCNKPDDPVDGKHVITAIIDCDLTKTSLGGNDTDGYKVFWSEEDDLFLEEIFEDSEDYFIKWSAKYKLDKSFAGAASGSFEWNVGDYFLAEEYSEPVFEEGDGCMALYPFDFVDLDDDGFPTGFFTWKTEQTYSTDAQYVPMLAMVEVPDRAPVFNFKNLGGMLCLKVKGTATVRSIKVSAADDEAMSGTVYAIINDDDDNMVAFMTNEVDEDDIVLDAKNYITLDCGKDGAPLSSKGTDFYISVPCHYTIDGTRMVLDGYSGVTITLTDIKGNTCINKLDNKLVIELNKITTASFTADF